MTPVTDDEADGQDSRHRHGPQGQQHTGDAAGILHRPDTPKLRAARATKTMTQAIRKRGTFMVPSWS